MLTQDAIAAMERHEKYIVLGVIASYFAYGQIEDTDWHYRSAPPLYFVADGSIRHHRRLHSGIRQQKRKFLT